MSYDTCKILGEFAYFDRRKAHFGPVDAISRCIAQSGQDRHHLHRPIPSDRPLSTIPDTQKHAAFTRKHAKSNRRKSLLWLRKRPASISFCDSHDWASVVDSCGGIASVDWLMDVIDVEVSVMASVSLRILRICLAADCAVNRAFLGPGNALIRVCLRGFTACKPIRLSL